LLARRPEMAGKPLSIVPHFPWEVAYMEVLRETDNARLVELSRVAQGTLLLRLLELAKGSEREIQAVEDTLGKCGDPQANKRVFKYLMDSVQPVTRAVALEGYPWIA
jgi:hypothetical protein